MSDGSVSATSFSDTGVPLVRLSGVPGGDRSGPGSGGQGIGIEGALERVLHGRTVIEVTHEMTDLDRFDAVYRLEQGRLTTVRSAGTWPRARLQGGHL